MQKNRWSIITGLLIGVLVLASCTAQNGAGQPTMQSVDLANTSWTLLSYGPTGAPIEALPTSPVTLAFDGEGGVGGSSGCNSYGGKYQQEGATIRFSEVVSTLMACTDAGVMDLEQQFLGALQSTGSFVVSGDNLTINYNDGQGALNFTRSGG